VSELSLTDACYEEIKSSIISANLAPGTRFTEKEIIASTGYGRTPVREALAKLDTDGLIKTRPRSGYSVVEVDVKTVQDLYDVWKVIAPLMVRRAAENFNDEYKEKWSAHLALLPADASTEQILESNQTSFNILAEATGNAHIILLNKRMGAMNHLIQSLFLSTEEGLDWARRQTRYFMEEPWYEVPEAAEARMLFAITAYFTAVLKKIEDLH